MIHMLLLQPRYILKNPDQFWERLEKHQVHRGVITRKALLYVVTWSRWGFSAPRDVTYLRRARQGEAKSLQWRPGHQEIQNQMVLGLQNSPVDPYIVRKLQPCGSQMYAYFSVRVCHCWIICHWILAILVGFWSERTSLPPEKCHYITDK
jgi:hypothetical protein